MSTHKKLARIALRLLVVSVVALFALPIGCTSDAPPTRSDGSRADKPARVRATILLAKNRLKLVGLRAAPTNPLPPPSKTPKPHLTWRYESETGEILASGTITDPRLMKTEKHAAGTPRLGMTPAGTFEVEVPNQRGRLLLFPPQASGGGSQPQFWEEIEGALEVVIDELVDIFDFGDDEEDEIEIFDEEPFVGQTQHVVSPTSKCSAFSLLFVAEGYQLGEQAKFEADVQHVIKVMKAKSGYAANWKFMHVYSKFFESRESGISDDDTGTVKDTAFRLTKERGSVGLYLAADTPPISHAEVAHAKAESQADVTLWLANSTLDAGSARPWERVGYFTTDGVDDAGNVAAHELAHALFDLEDEYDHAPDCDPSAIPEGPNVVRAGDPIPWAAMMSDGVAIPTTEIDTDLIGAFEGAYYCATGFYRPQLFCAMESTEDDFCKVCQAAINKAFAKRTPSCQPKPGCAHGECKEGGALSKSCSTCASAVCDYEPRCCESGKQWDAECVALAQSIPGACAGICAVNDSTCGHDECEQGEALDSSCSSCATSVCARDPFCCDNEWDHICAREAEDDPFCGCAP